MAKKSLAARIKESVSADKIIRKKDGSYEFQRHYFYRPFRPSHWSAEVRARIEAAGFDAALVDMGDVFNVWPKDSYLWVRFRVSERAPLGRLTEGEIAEDSQLDLKADADERDAKADLFS